MKIAELRNLGACSDALAHLEKHRTWARAVAACDNLSWFEWLFKRVRGPAWAEYEQVCGPAWAAYERVRGPASAEYERVRGVAWAEYERVCDSAWAEYEQVRGPAWAEHERVMLVECRRIASAL